MMSKKLKKIIIIMLAIIIVISIILAIPKIIAKINEPQEGRTGDPGYNVGYTKDSVKDLTTIEGLSAELKNKIPDLEGLYFNIKKYMAQNGLIDSPTLTLEEYQEQDNELKMRFKMSDNNKTRLLVKLNLTNSQTEINYYK